MAFTVTKFVVLQVLSKVAAKLLKTKDCGSIGTPQQKQTKQIKADSFFTHKGHIICHVTPKKKAINETSHLQKAKATVKP